MATTTTNYGFDVPTSSDLVKNGATAISTLGQDIDTFLFRPFTRNGLLNSQFNVWQRGTSIAGATAINYTADQWQLFRAGTTITRQATGDTTNLPNIQYCARVQRNSGTSGTSAVLLSQSIETANAISYAGKTVTLSFYARKGANYSGADSGMGATVFTGTGTDQNYIAGFTGLATAFTGAATLTTTWQRFTFTGSIAATATEVAVNFSYEPVGTAGAADYFEVTGAMLEVGNQASPYAPAGSSIQAELAMCQRYYQRRTSGTEYATMAQGYVGTGTSNMYGFISLPVQMRSAPTFGSTAASTFRALISGTAPALTAIGAGSLTVDAVRLDGTTTGLTTGFGGEIQSNNSATAYVEFSAEL